MDSKETNDMQAKTWISIREAASMLDMTYEGVRYLIRGGHIEGIKPARDWLVTRESVEKYDLERKQNIG